MPLNKNQMLNLDNLDTLKCNLGLNQGQQISINSTLIKLKLPIFQV